MANRVVKNRGPARRSAFTLPELLIVIVVMLILVALLLPVLSRAKDAARRTVDISALRQVGIASVNYASDNQGWFPWRGEAFFPGCLRQGPLHGPTDLNDTFVNPYVGNRADLMFCVEFPWPADDLWGPEGDGNDHPVFNYSGRFYYNWQPDPVSQWVITPPDLRRGDKNPASPLWSCQTWQWTKGPYAGLFVAHGLPRVPWAPLGGCYVYVDGHAGWRPWSQHQLFGQWQPTYDDSHDYFWPGPDL